MELSSSRERYLRAGRNVLFATIEQVVSTAASIARVPLLLHWLGVTGYGLWVATAGALATVQLLKLGIQYSVVSIVARAVGEGDAEGARDAVATSFLVFLAICAAMLLVLVPIFIVLPIPWLLRVPGDLVVQTRIALIVSAASTLICMPLQVFNSALIGYQQGYIISRWRSLISILQTLGVAVAVALTGRVTLATAATYYAVFDISAALIFVYLIVARWKPELRIGRRNWKVALVRGLVTLGVFYLIGDLANLLKLSFGSLMVSHFNGPDAVVPFAITLSLATLLLSLGALVTAPFWPAYGEAVARGEWDWAQAAFARSSTLATVLGGACAAGLLVGGSDLVMLWTRSRIEPDTVLVAALSGWLLAQMWMTSSSSLLSGLAQNRGLAMVALAEGGLGLALSVPAARQLGGAGVAGAMLAASLIAGAIRPRLVRQGTDGRVGYPPFLLLGAFLCAGAAAAAGLLLRRTLAGAPPLVLFLVATAVAVLLYAGLAWRLILSADVRSFVRRAAGELWSRFSQHLRGSTAP